MNTVSKKEKKNKEKASDEAFFMSPEKMFFKLDNNDI